MISIEEEIAILKPVLMHAGGFNINMAGLLCIRPVTECSPPIEWEVDWEDEAGIVHDQVFDDLDTALHFFVSLRHTRELGLDFEAEYYRKVDSYGI